jgi:hypothetical protein
MTVPAGDRWPDTAEVWAGYNGPHKVKTAEGIQTVQATVTQAEQDPETGAVIISAEYTV